MAIEAVEINSILNDGDILENENPNDEVEGDDYAFQILLTMRAHGEV